MYFLGLFLYAGEGIGVMEVGGKGSEFIGRAEVGNFGDISGTKL